MNTLTLEINKSHVIALVYPTLSWDRHSADARRPYFIDLTMKTTINNRQTSPHIYYIYTLCNKIKYLTFLYRIKFHKINAQNSSTTSPAAQPYRRIAITLFSFTQKNTARRHVYACEYLKMFLNAFVRAK